MARESFNFYDYFYEPIKHFKEIDRASIIIAIIEYCLYEKEPDWLNDICTFAFNTLKPKLDLNIMRYKNGCKGGESGRLGKEYGKLGGRPKKIGGGGRIQIWEYLLKVICIYFDV